MKIYSSVSELIGRTPLMRLDRYMKNNDLKANIIAKLEFFNPAGSVKDRVALNMLEEAKHRGYINADSVIIEPTSGNTGIGLASISASMGYRVILTMPETMSIERQKLLKAYGAEIVLTDGKLGMQGAIEKAYELAASIPNSYIPGQFENPCNPQAHYKSTAPEIWEDTEGNIDFFVAGIGTGGTITGNGTYFKMQDPAIKVVGYEPLSSPFLTRGVKGAHKIQGIGAGFVPEVLDINICDEIITVSDESAINTAKELARTEGVLAGISSGGALYAARLLAEREENRGKNIVVILPDTGERYLSTEMFE